MASASPLTAAFDGRLREGLGEQEVAGLRRLLARLEENVRTG